MVRHYALGIEITVNDNTTVGDLAYTQAMRNNGLISFQQLWEAAVHAAFQTERGTNLEGVSYDGQIVMVCLLFCHSWIHNNE